MYIVDAHQDIAFNYICFNRDYRRAALLKRHGEVGSKAAELNGATTLGLPEALIGRVALVFATLFVAGKATRPGPWENLLYDSPQAAYEKALKQLDYYERLVDEDERLVLVKTQADLDTVLATWRDDADIKSRKQGLVLLMENADPIIEPKQFEEWYERGVRLVGPAWQRTRYSGGTAAPGPLTPLGYELLEVMASFNAILDLSHMAEKAYLQAVERYEGVLIASHSNPRKFCDTDRHLSDEMIRLLAERDGVIGVVLANFFLDGTWKRSDGKAKLPLERAIMAIDHICQLTGSAQHVGIGSDFDGGFGAGAIPHELDTVADLWLFKDRLLERGFNEDDTAAILGGNMTRKLREALT
jgi:membrane dipeptidase